MIYPRQRGHIAKGSIEPAGANLAYVGEGVLNIDCSNDGRRMHRNHLQVFGYPKTQRL
jgi:hypothetical protein